jgi:hypothetical protein
MDKRSARTQSNKPSLQLLSDHQVFARLADPFLFFKQFSVHDRDLAGGPAKADKAKL